MRIKKVKTRILSLVLALSMIVGFSQMSAMAAVDEIQGAIAAAGAVAATLDDLRELEGDYRGYINSLELIWPYGNIANINSLLNQAKATYDEMELAKGTENYLSSTLTAKAKYDLYEAAFVVVKQIDDIPDYTTVEQYKTLKATGLEDDLEDAEAALSTLTSDKRAKVFNAGALAAKRVKFDRYDDLLEIYDTFIQIPGLMTIDAVTASNITGDDGPEYQYTKNAYQAVVDLVNAYRGNSDYINTYAVDLSPAVMGYDIDASIAKMWELIQAIEDIDELMEKVGGEDINSNVKGYLDDVSSDYSENGSTTKLTAASISDLVSDVSTMYSNIDASYFTNSANPLYGWTIEEVLKFSVDYFDEEGPLTYADYVKYLDDTKYYDYLVKIDTAFEALSLVAIITDTSQLESNGNGAQYAGYSNSAVWSRVPNGSAPSVAGRLDDDVFIGNTSTIAEYVGDMLEALYAIRDDGLTNTEYSDTIDILMSCSMLSHNSHGNMKYGNFIRLEQAGAATPYVNSGADKGTLSFANNEGWDIVYYYYNGYLESQFVSAVADMWKAVGGAANTSINNVAFASYNARKESYDEAFPKLISMYAYFKNVDNYSSNSYNKLNTILQSEGSASAYNSLFSYGNGGSYYNNSTVNGFRNITGVIRAMDRYRIFDAAYGKKVEMDKIASLLKVPTANSPGLRDAIKGTISAEKDFQSLVAFYNETLRIDELVLSITDSAYYSTEQGVKFYTTTFFGNVSPATPAMTYSALINITSNIISAVGKLNEVKSEYAIATYDDYDAMETAYGEVDNILGAITTAYTTAGIDYAKALGPYFTNIMDLASTLIEDFEAVEGIMDVLEYTTSGLVYSDLSDVTPTGKESEIIDARAALDGANSQQKSILAQAYRDEKNSPLLTDAQALAGVESELAALEARIAQIQLVYDVVYYIENELEATITGYDDSTDIFVDDTPDTGDCAELQALYELVTAENDESLIAMLDTEVEKLNKYDTGNDYADVVAELTNRYNALVEMENYVTTKLDVLVDKHASVQPTEKDKYIDISWDIKLFNVDYASFKEEWITDYDYEGTELNTLTNVSTVIENLKKKVNNNALSANGKTYLEAVMELKYFLTVENDYAWEESETGKPFYILDTVDKSTYDTLYGSVKSTWSKVTGNQIAQFNSGAIAAYKSGVDGALEIRENKRSNGSAADIFEVEVASLYTLLFPAGTLDEDEINVYNFKEFKRLWNLYNNVLTQEQRELLNFNTTVTYLNTLRGALVQDSIVNVNADLVAAETVYNLISNLNFNSIDSTAINAAYNAYEALTEIRITYVGEDMRDRLIDAIAELLIDELDIIITNSVEEFADIDQVTLTQLSTTALIDAVDAAVEYLDILTEYFGIDVTTNYNALLTIISDLDKYEVHDFADIEAEDYEKYVELLPDIYEIKDLLDYLAILNGLYTEMASLFAQLDIIATNGVTTTTEDLDWTVYNDATPKSNITGAIAAAKTFITNIKTNYVGIELATAFDGSTTLDTFTDLVNFVEGCMIKNSEDPTGDEEEEAGNRKALILLIETALEAKIDKLEAIEDLMAAIDDVKTELLDEYAVGTYTKADLEEIKAEFVELYEETYDGDSEVKDIIDEGLVDAGYETAPSSGEADFSKFILAVDYIIEGVRLHENFMKFQEITGFESSLVISVDGFLSKYNLLKQSVEDIQEAIEKWNSDEPGYGYYSNPDYASMNDDFTGSTASFQAHVSGYQAKIDEFADIAAFLNAVVAISDFLDENNLLGDIDDEELYAEFERLLGAATTAWEDLDPAEETAVKTGMSVASDLNVGASYWADYQAYLALAGTSQDLIDSNNRKAAFVEAAGEVVDTWDNGDGEWDEAGYQEALRLYGLLINTEPNDVMAEYLALVQAKVNSGIVTPGPEKSDVEKYAEDVMALIGEVTAIVDGDNKMADIIALVINTNTGKMRAQYTKYIQDAEFYMEIFDDLDEEDPAYSSAVAANAILVAAYAEAKAGIARILAHYGFGGPDYSMDIDDIGENILNFASAIENARALYNALTEDEKLETENGPRLLTELTTLEVALEEALAEKAIEDFIADVAELIDDFAETGVIDMNPVEAIGEVLVDGVLKAEYLEYIYRAEELFAAYDPEETNEEYKTAYENLVAAYAEVEAGIARIVAHSLFVDYGYSMDVEDLEEDILELEGLIIEARELYVDLSAEAKLTGCADKLDKAIKALEEALEAAKEDAKEPTPAEEVGNKIDEIKDVDKEDPNFDEEEYNQAVKDAWEAYDELSKADKALADPNGVLKGLYDEVVANETNNEIQGKIEEFGGVINLETLADGKQAVQEAKELFYSLTADQRALLDDVIKELENLEKTIIRLEYDKEKGIPDAVIGVIYAINALPAVEDITKDNADEVKATIDGIREAYQALKASEKAQVYNYKTLQEIEAKIITVSKPLTPAEISDKIEAFLTAISANDDETIAELGAEISDAYTQLTSAERKEVVNYIGFLIAYNNWTKAQAA